jgi:D-alanine transaminase
MNRFHGWPTKMPVGHIAYVNGRYMPLAQAGVHVEDRALQFADGIYEVVGVLDGFVLDEEHHLDRLERSVGEIGMAMPMARAALKLVIREMARRNRVVDGLIYMQVTRGSYRRDHAIPSNAARPTLIVTARPMNRRAVEDRREKGVAVITRPDQRWARCDIKSTALLPNILAKTEARNTGAFEAWLIDREGFVTEGSSTSAWIVDKAGNIVTRDLSNAILPGVTRREIMDTAAESQIAIQERAFTREEVLTAREAFVTAATLGATPVVSVDGHPIGDGKPGPVARRLQELYRKRAEKLAGAA